MTELLGVAVEDHHHWSAHVAASFGIAFAALFPIVDPIGNVPIFVALTRNLPIEERQAQALRAAVATVVILVLFLFFGRLLLELFEIELAALEVAGGLLVGYTGFQMATGAWDDAETAPQAGSSMYLTPLAIPLLAGPGAMGAVLGLGSRSDSHLDYIGFVVGIAAVAALCLVLFKNGERVARRLGPGGIVAVNRIFGLLTLAIAAEMVFHGEAELT